MDLTSRYLGLELKHPVVASASPLTATLDGMRRLEDAGAAAVVMSSVYEEQIRAELIEAGMSTAILRQAARSIAKRLDVPEHQAVRLAQAAIAKAAA